MKLLAFVLLCALLAGCAASPSRTDPAQTQGRVRVTADSQNANRLFAGLDQRLYITHVDNVSTNTACFHWPDCYAQEVFVEPGRRYLKLKYAHLNGYANATVWFDAQREKAYIVRKRITGYSVQFWMEEAATGQRVGGIPGAEEEKR